MAKILGKDPTTYPKERDGFLRDLHHFHETRGTPFKRTPILAGKEVDLYLLYSLVTAQGGWIKVNSKNTWTEVLDDLELPKECVNGSVALKQIYLRYLDRWEKVHFLGEEADRGSDDDEESRHKRWSARALHSVPHTYNYSQHVIAEANREYNHLSADLYKASDYDRLALSLISPLPNEQDFAINVCTLLSNDGKHTLKLERHPRIVDYLLAHAGVFSHSSLRKMVVCCYAQVRKHPIHNFWNQVLEFREFLDLTNETKFNITPSPSPVKKSFDEDPMETNTCEITSDNESDCEVANVKFECKLREEPIDEDLFCLGRALGTQDYIGQRVLQVATILRNLSFIEENVPILLRNRTFVRFILLCTSARWGYLRNLGFDMLGNLAAEYLVKDYPSDRLSAVMLKSVALGLQSQDRTACICSLEVLNKLSQNEANEETIVRYLDDDVYVKVCSFLTIHDVMLLIYTLECLYSLSSLGERSCNLIVTNHGVVDTLVSLVTVEGKSYGPKACIGMKLVETLPGGHSTTASHQTVTAPVASSSGSTSSSTATPQTSAVSTTVLTPAPITTKLASNPTTPLRTVQIAPQRLLAVAPSTTTTSATSVVTAVTPQQLMQQQHAHQQAIHENEQFALTWLRANYEPCANGRVDHQELYKQYLNSCSKIGRRGVISPLHFPRCVRSVFGGTVGPNPMKPTTVNEPQYYEGIKVMAHPHLSQALLGGVATTTTATSAGTSKDALAGQSNTSLIKSLLATKVNDCMTTVSMRTATDCQTVAQVAARQQQQRLLAQQVNTTPNIDTNRNALVKNETPKSCRVNGARQLFADGTGDVGDPSVSSTTHFTNMVKGKKEPPQPPPPPLAPLSSTNKAKHKFENEDSDSTGNNSLASSSGMGTIGIGGISSTEDGDNSLTSFEGLLNGIPNIDNPLNEDSNNSKDSVRVNEITKNKPLRLADLLEQKIEKAAPPLLNGSLGKELRLGEKAMDLVENHIEKALSTHDSNCTDKKEDVQLMNLKRPANDDSVEPEAKKPLLSNNNVNGASSNSADSPAPESVSSSNGEEGTTVSTAAAKLFADIAADILEGEDEEQLMQEAQAPPVVEQPPPPTPAPPVVPQLIVDNNQQMLLTQPRQIIVSQAQIQSSGGATVYTGATQLKTQTGQTVIVQNAGQQRTPMVLQQNAGQILLSQGLQGLQGQMQLVASSTQPGQYVLQTSGAPGTYMVAQPQTAVVHGQQQTVLVAQTAQQQGSGTKTIIILQQQPATGATHHQKVMVTPQGQQVVVTQVHRPMLQTSTVTNNIVPTATSVIKSAPVTAAVATNGVAAVVPIEKKEDVKPKIIRDLTTPFVCEWGDCNLDTKFKSANQVYLHVCDAHCPKGSEEIVCQWDRCDNMKRKRFSLMTHIHDKHCNTEAMKQSLTRRKQVSHGGKVEPPPPAPATPHPGYAPDAALHAIKRHALEFVNPKELQQKGGAKQGTPSVPAPPPRPGPPPPDQDDNEGPVTKSIRLTASLILRNLVIYSSSCRRYLKHYEPHLANVALSNVESSRTIAQVLYDMNEGSNHR